jgi:hypothetical protein
MNHKGSDAPRALTSSAHTSYPAGQLDASSQPKSPHPSDGWSPRARWRWTIVPIFPPNVVEWEGWDHE